MYKIKVIERGTSRYPTVGDYYEENGTHIITVENTGDEFLNDLVALHELAELIMTKHNRIPISEIDNFDKQYKGDEPGDDESAPYYKEHQAASTIERILCIACKKDWTLANNRIEESYTRTYEGL